MIGIYWKACEKSLVYDPLPAEPTTALCLIGAADDVPLKTMSSILLLSR